ncbi:DUF6801 domain-containing protein [Streptomyces sp. NPDC058439]|uniref:DUF6801 domain-containing protein n=1 Tax=Streptomyces sp. NPDC058439 TaxID=3346500 RepID=UPI00365082EC
MASSVRWTTRQPARIAAGGLLVVAATFLPGADSAADAQRAEISLDYNCQFPEGSYAVTAVVAGRFPAGGRVGRPVEPRDVTVEVDLPKAALDELTGLDATAVSAAVRLKVLHAMSKESATADWSGLTAPAQDIAGQDGLKLEAAGAVPTATFGSPGTAILSASDLTLALSPLKEDGSAAVPDGIDVACRLVDGADGTLASLTIGGPAKEKPAEPTPEDLPDLPDLAGKLPPSQREKLNDARHAARAEGDTDPEPCPFPPFSLATPAETYVAGFTNVKKLNSAALLGPARLNVVLMKTYIADPCTDTFTVLSEADFDYNGRRQLPPSQGTFLTYGFMPTTATMVLSQVGPPALITSVSHNSDPRIPEDTTVTADFELTISDVRVNGEPLDVGPNCRTVKPIKQTLYAFGTGNPPSGYTVNRGGTMSGETYIPAFTGCGVDEDLSPLMTASISGGGNFIKMTQAPLCVVSNPDSPDCPAKKPIPER